MKSGGPWNLKGSRPPPRAAARDAAQKPGVSLGEWLNSVVQSSQDGDLAEENGRRLPPSEKPRHHRDRIHHDETRVRYEGRPYRDERSADREEHRRNSNERRHEHGDHWRDRHDHSRRHERHHDPREIARDEIRHEEARHEEARREAAREERRLTHVHAEAKRDAIREDAHCENPRRDALHEAEWREAIREPERRVEAADEAAAQQADQEAAAREQSRREIAREEARREQAREDAAREERRLETVREEARREAARAREGLGGVNERLDQLTQQLDRLAHAQATRQRAMLARLNEPAELPKPQQLTGAPAPRRRTKPEPVLSIDDAVAEITARQRVLDSETAAPLSAIAPDLADADGPSAPAAAPAAPMGNAASRPARLAEAGTPGRAPLHSAALDAAIVQASPPAPAMDLSVLEAHLRQITARIDALQPAGDIEKAIAAVRTDLAEIGRQLGEALPRRALESLEIEVKALGERIDHSRQCRVDPNTLAGLERGLAEVREALRTLTPAENLVGFDETVKALTQKLDMIPAREDPSALQQLEAAIDGLRGVVTHVASNDTLARVAEDVRALASQVDRIANSTTAVHGVSPLGQHFGDLPGPADGVPGDAATRNAVSALGQRIDTLTAALAASGEAGQATPRDLEKLLAGLTEKLERLQLTNTDQAALAPLEDRIAGLVQRFDASDARLGHLDAIERGLADLLVHVDEIRVMKGGAAPAPQEFPAVATIERDVAEIKQSERHTQDTLEAVQGIVEHLVDRLATIEGSLHREWEPRAAPVAQSQPAHGPALVPAAHEAEFADAAQAAVSASSATLFGPPPSPSAPALISAEPPASPSANARPAIDPSLPPDHPLEPGFTSSRPRTASAAERIADSEAAIGSAKPPVISDAERPNFIAAARRAAQAAAWEPPRSKPRGGAGAEQTTAAPSKLSQNVRKLIVAGSVVLILVGCIRIATKLFLDGSNSGATSQSPSEQIAPSAAPPQQAIPSQPKQPSSSAAPALPPSATAPALPLPTPAPAVPPSMAPAKTTMPGRQSMRHADDQTAEATVTRPGGGKPGAVGLPSWAVPDITGALPSPQVAPGVMPAAGQAAAVVDDKLPVTIGNAALRKAAAAGDPAAAYEIATRFAEGSGVLQNDEETAHWLQHAADHGLAPAQFRLGGIYEKGLGVKKDLARARDLYLAAAQQGNGNAMHNLAVLYAEGVDGPPDYDQAAMWFRKAADHGIRDSEYNLGILYARGIGVKQDNSESYKWFALAAKEGDKDAAGKRDQIASRLDPQSLAAARLAVQNWSPEAQPDDAINVKTMPAWDAPAKSAQTAKP
jgi:localization factor PodJL